jgi:hypothetical protein
MIAAIGTLRQWFSSYPQITRQETYATPTAIGTTDVPLVPFSQVFMSWLVEHGVLEVALEGLVPSGVLLERDIVGRNDPCPSPQRPAKSRILKGLYDSWRWCRVRSDGGASMVGKGVAATGSYGLDL